MEADWDEITRIAVPSSGLHAIPSPASAVIFDELQELLWVGNDQVSQVGGTVRGLNSHLAAREDLSPSTAGNCNGMSQSRHIWGKVL